MSVKSFDSPPEKPLINTDYWMHNWLIFSTLQSWVYLFPLPSEFLHCYTWSSRHLKRGWEVLLARKYSSLFNKVPCVLPAWPWERVWLLSEAGDGAENVLVCCGAQRDQGWVLSTLTSSFMALYWGDRILLPLQNFFCFNERLYGNG